MELKAIEAKARLCHWCTDYELWLAGDCEYEPSPKGRRCDGFHRSPALGVQPKTLVATTGTQ